MVTKSKSYKHTFAVKCICIVLSIVCLLSGSLCAVYLPVYAYFNNLSEWKSTTKSFMDTTVFFDYVRSDVQALDNLMHSQAELQNVEKTAAKKKEAVEAEIQRFQREKATIIANEVYYVATHYDRETDDYYEQAYRDQFEKDVSSAADSENAVVTVPASNDAQKETTPETQPPEPTETTTTERTIPQRQVSVDDHAPYNVRYCQMLVNTVNDLDWLQYESLVRSEAFEEREFSVSFSEYTNYNLGSDTFTFLITEPQLQSDLERKYDSVIAQIREMISSNRSEWERQLRSKVNFLYYGKAEDGTIYADPKRKDPSAKSFESLPMWVTITADGVTEAGEDSAPLMTAIENEYYSPSLIGNESITVGFAQIPFLPGDNYYNAQTLFDAVVSRFSPISVLICVGISLVILLASSILLLVYCGHVEGVDGVRLLFIDQIPTDVHLLCSVGCCIGAGTGLIFLADQMGMHLHSYTDVLNPFFIAGLLVLIVLLWLVGMEWLTSAVRIKKAGESFFGRFILWSILKILFRGARRCLRLIRKGLHFLLDKPKKIRYIFLSADLLFAFLVVLLILIGAFKLNLVIPVIGIPVLTLFFLLAQVYFLRMLDRIIEASSDRSKFPIKGIEQMPNALQTLANNLTITNRDLDQAVADAVKNERTKAELITNVSHDLKTPLTSVISYVDLLKQCGITDTKALEYLDTLTEKSEKLKHLVDDLIEASKVSTGNITLQPVPLNLSELAMQAIVECTLALEAQGLEIKFSQPDKPPIIHADSTKTYRVLENLLSNVRKYAAPQSRVYACVNTVDGFGRFEIKNISKDPLNIDPEELMERFVRGDTSRSEEGNGLGLSIAQQLCALQGGKLEISIDGDLFKATVYLPLEEVCDV